MWCEIHAFKEKINKNMNLLNCYCNSQNLNSAIVPGHFTLVCVFTDVDLEHLAVSG